MRWTWVIILMVSSFSAFGQDGQFSQYFTTKMLINPAFAGIRPEMELSSNYKKSGSKESETFFELSQASFIFPLKVVTSTEHQVGGVGATFFRERRGFQGIFTSQKLLLSGAYSIRLSQFVKNFVVFGLQAGMVQNRLSNDVLNWGSQFNRFYGYDDTLPGEALSAGAEYYPTVNFGVLYTIYDNEKIYIRDKSLILGLSADNLNRPVTGENTDLRKNVLFKAFGSFKLELSSRWYFHPSALILSEGNNAQLNFGTYFTSIVSSVRSKASVAMKLGAWYRQGDSFIVLGGVDLENLSLGVSFDLNSNTFTENIVFQRTNPSYEVSLTYIFTRANNNIRRVSNPIF